MYKSTLEYSRSVETKTLYIEEITAVTAHDTTIKRQLACKSASHFTVVIASIQEL